MTTKRTAGARWMNSPRAWHRRFPFSYSVFFNRNHHQEGVAKTAKQREQKIAAAVAYFSAKLGGVKPKIARTATRPHPHDAMLAEAGLL